MSNEILAKLEGKIDNALETIELLRLQIEELDEKNKTLQQENFMLKDKHNSWEKNLTLMLSKLDTIDHKNAEAKQAEFEEVIPV